MVMSSPVEEPTIQSQEPNQAPEEQEEILESEDIQGQQRTEDLVERQKAKIDAQKAEILRLRSSKRRRARKYRASLKQMARRELHFGKVTGAHKEILEKRDQRINSMEDELARAKDLLTARSAELVVVRSFLSTTDHTSEAEVLGIVRDLNKNMCQVATDLAKEWKKLKLPQSNNTPGAVIDSFYRSYSPTLVNQLLDGDSEAVALVIRSCLCALTTRIAFGWRRGKELGSLGSVYKSLSASEKQATSARWRSLTHSHLSSTPSSHSAWIVEHIADILRITGSFSSVQRSLNFVHTVAPRGIEAIDRLAIRLQSVFMVDVTSSDMRLLFETPGSVFDHRRMSHEFEPNGAPNRTGKDKVAATTEVGVGKKVSQGHTEFLLKAKVVLERDLRGSREVEGESSCVLA